MKKSPYNLSILVIAVTLLFPFHATAQEVQLRLHQFLPANAPVPSLVLKPWRENIEKLSNGRIEIQQYDSMALGGKPPDLIDQAQDGVVDISMTVVGYTPGRFPRSEVFELPFMMTDHISTTKAFWELVDTELQHNEYSKLKVLGAWVHGPGVIHSIDPIQRLEDLKGKTLRGPTRTIVNLLSELGATPIGLPLTATPEAISKGVVTGAVLPWEVSPAIRLSELVTNHTEFTLGDEALYTATIVMVMNKERYESIPADLRKILDSETGEKFSVTAAELMYEMDAPGRKIAEDSNNNFIQLEIDEIQRWKDASKPVAERWIKEMDEQGISGEELIEKAKALIQKHGG